MKNKLLIIGISVMLMLIASCMKDNSSANYAIIDSEKAKIKNALELSKAFNDTLKTVYDAAITPHYNPTCLRYDSLFHSSDSMFNVHYFLFGDEMYKNGIMMSNYTPSNGMMQGGMMSNGMMSMQLLRGDTVVVNGFYRNMHQLRVTHQPYHNGIYN